MNEQRLKELLREPAPGEHEATRRSHRIVRAAFDARQPATPWRAWARPAAALASGLMLAVLALVVALTPAGEAIASWIRGGLEQLADGEHPAEPGLTSLPSGGELLVLSEAGPWIVHADGSQRLLGDYDEASWSPNGLYVVAARGRQLTALTPEGDPRWSLNRHSRVASPRWSPSGLRVAYLSGGALRTIDGNGTDDALVASQVADTPPAWRPGEAHVLAFADRAGGVEVVDVDAGRRLWRSQPAEPPAELVWSSDGERLIAVGRRTLRVFDASGGEVDVLRLRGGGIGYATDGAGIAAFAPHGHRFALIRASEAPGQSEVVLLDAERHPAEPRQLFAGPGSFSGLAWSPDGRSLLLGWPSADHWLFLRADRPSRVSAVSHVSRQFDPGGAARPRFPEIAGWCCPP